ncbi:MAG: oxidoreductase [Rudanella sp.]|nr:oxidoreductase [Rudanella sp.]
MKLLPFLLLLITPAFAQWKMLPVNTAASFRAVSAANGKVIWIGGSGGTFLRSTDGGDTWQTGTVKGAETCDFRDVQAIDAQTAVFMSAGPAEQGQARIYRTTNGGQSWTLCYQTQQAGVFFDGLSFWNVRQGIAFSDPVAGRYVLIRTDDGGQTWQPIPPSQSPAVHPGEAAFAASGSSIVVQGSQNVWIGSGGVGGGRVFRSTDSGRSWAVSETGIPADSSKGVFGLHFFTAKDGIAVGGDHKNVTTPGPNLALTHDGGKTWSPMQPATPAGLKEAAWRLPNGHWLLVGPSGTSLSANEGKTWQSLDQEPFHALVCTGNTCWAVGAKGRVARRTF